MQGRIHVPPSDRSGLTTYLFCLFLGNFGIHRFYTGHILTGILMLLTGGGCGIWTMIDLILIATNQFADIHGNRLQFTDAHGKWPHLALIGTGLVLAIIGVSLLLSTLPAMTGASLAGAGATAFAVTATATAPSMGLILALGFGVVVSLFALGFLGQGARRYFSPHQPVHLAQPYPHHRGVNIHRRLDIDPRYRFDFHSGGPMPPPTDFGHHGNRMPPPIGYGHGHGGMAPPVFSHVEPIIYGNEIPPPAPVGHGHAIRNVNRP